MSLAPCRSEERMQRLDAARTWLRARGVSCKTDFELTAPVPRYQLSTSAKWLTADAVIAEAVSLGWSQ